jgi:hypothetical protein
MLVMSICHKYPIHEPTRKMHHHCIHPHYPLCMRPCELMRVAFVHVSAQVPAYMRLDTCEMHLHANMHVSMVQSA